jgi:hypothetical protein
MNFETLNEISLDQNDSNHVLLEKEIFLHQSDNIQIPSDQNDSNDDLCRTRRALSEISLDLMSFENEISLDQCDNVISSDQSDDNRVSSLFFRVLNFET